MAEPAETVVHLIRHGEVDNPGRLRYGQLMGFPLTPRGRDQARLAASRVRSVARGPIAAIVSSPLARAVETATLVRLALDREDELVMNELVIDDRLIEASSDFDGRHRLAVIGPWHWPKLWNPLRPSWGEPFAAVTGRMLAALAAFRAAWPGGTVVAVSHQSPIWLARQALIAPPPPWRSTMKCAHASITTLRFSGERFAGFEYWAP
jgi:broad specificity phosphatase PhoE